jgi:hypothetical protein
MLRVIIFRRINAIVVREDKMLNRFLFIICGLLLLAGCQPQQVADPLAYGPDVETIAVTNDFTSRAVASTGGCKAWLNAEKLELDCIVTFYNRDGTYYLTKQHHEIYAWSNSVRISAIEPQGRFVWLLSQNKFTPPQAQIQYDVHNMIYAVRDITTAPARFLDKSVEFSKTPEPVKIQGLWYYQIGSFVSSDKSRETVFYQSRDTSLIDIIRFIDSAEKESLMVRGYDYRRVEAVGLLLPMRIEVFSTNAAGLVQYRLLKIDYYNN